MSVYDGMMKGLSEALEHAEGKRTLRTEKLYVEPLHTYSAEEIKKIRSDLGMTQVLFADVLGVSTKTVEAWEAGRNQPEGPVRRIFAMLQQDPDLPEKYRIVTR